jgi:hypothetical protein
MNPPSTDYKLICEFTLQGLPKTTNGIARKHWKTQWAHSIKWKKLVYQKCLSFGVTNLKLSKAKLTLIRRSSREPDTDGLISGFKAIIDGLVECGVLVDDKPSIIGIPDYRWERSQIGHVYIKVEKPSE